MRVVGEWRGEPYINPAMAVLARHARGLSQASLAESAGVTIHSIRKFESGTLTPRSSTEKRIVEALQQPLEFFFQRPPEYRVKFTCSSRGCIGEHDGVPDDSRCTKCGHPLQ